MIGRVEKVPAAMQQEDIASEFWLPLPTRLPAIGTFDMQHTPRQQRGMRRAGRLQIQAGSGRCRPILPWVTKYIVRN